MGSLLPSPPTLYLIATLGDAARAPSGIAGIARAVREAAGAESLTLLFQLRDTKASARQLLEAAALWVPALAEHSAYLLINERVDVAVASGALGAHLSTESYSLGEARRLLPEGTLAYSAHSPEDARSAARDGADFITLSPIFESPGKGGPLGVGTLGAAAKLCGSTPVLALGGVNPGNLGEALAGGAAGIALIRPVFEADDPCTAAAAIARRLVEQTKKNS